MKVTDHGDFTSQRFAPRERPDDAVRAQHEKGNGPDTEPHASNRAREPRFKLIPFSEIRMQTDQLYAIKGLIPATGLVVVWGPPKSGKSFWTFDAMMHI